MSPHVAKVMQLCLRYLSYDPNYNYDAEEDLEDGMEQDGEEDPGAHTQLNGFCWELFAGFCSVCVCVCI